MCSAWHIGMRSTSALWAVRQDENGSVNRFGGWLVKSTELLALISALAGHIDLAICRDVLCDYQFNDEIHYNSIAENASHYPASEHITVELLEGKLTSRAQMTIKGCTDTCVIGSHEGRKL